MQADGVNRIDFGTLGQNTDGVIASLPPSFPFTYGITSSGDLAVSLLSFSVGQGGISRGGEVAAIATTSPTATRSNVFCFLEKGAGLSAATLSGAYHFGYFEMDATLPASHVGTVGTVTFNGAGGASLDSDVANADGFISPFDIPPAPITYAVAADGTLTTGPSGVLLHGGVLPGGDFAILSGGTVAGEDPAGLVLVRQQASASVASLQGIFTIVGVAYDLGLATIESVTGTFTADGAGAYGFQGTLHRPATGITAFGPNAGTYAVAANGQVTVNAGGLQLRGAVSPNGEFAFFGGSITAGEDPQLYVLVRR
jgi:hypothetical protein